MFATLCGNAIEGTIELHVAPIDGSTGGVSLLRGVSFAQTPWFSSDQDPAWTHR